MIRFPPSPRAFPRYPTSHRRDFGICVLIFWTWLGCLGTAAWASEPPVRFVRLGVEDGLPDSQVHHIFQDRDGFLWFSTRDGLGRYDGYDFVVYRHDPLDPGTIHGNWVDAVHQDTVGDLWLPLGVGGIDRLHRSTDRFEHVADRVTGPEGAGDVAPHSLLAQNGDLWLGTQTNGVFRWRSDIGRLVPVASGIEETLAPSQRLANPSVGALLEDRHGRIWVGTCAGIEVIDPGRPEAPLWRFPTVRQSDPSPAELAKLRRAAPSCVSALYEDALGHLWAGTRGFGALKLTAPLGEDTSPPDLNAFQPTWLEDGDAPAAIGRSLRGIRGLMNGDVFFASADRGLSLYRADSGAFRHFPTTGDDRGPTSNNISRLFIDSKQRLWIGTFNAGLNLFLPSQERFQHFRSDPLDPHSLSGDAIASLFEDRAGNLWVGTFGEGANVYSPYRWKFISYGKARPDVPGLSGSAVTSLAQRQGDPSLWVGSMDGGLDRFDPSSEAFQAIPIRRDDGGVLGVTALESHGDTLWMANLDGRVRRLVEDNPPRFEVVDGLPRTMALAGDAPPALWADAETLWIGTSFHGLLRYDVASGAVRQYQLDPGELDQVVPIWALEKDHEGMLWIGTVSFGLYRFDPQREVFRIYTGYGERLDDLPNRSIKSIFETDDQRLWVGTFSGGMSQLNRETQRFVNWTVRQGLPSNKIESILEDIDGRLWLATNRGLARLDPDQGTPRIYDRGDGLQHDELQKGAALKTADGTLYFGGRSGITRVEPDCLVDNPRPPPVVLTEVLKFGRPMRFDRPLQDVQKIRLAHHENVLSLRFAALDFANPSKNRYRYRLKGFDSDWIQAGPSRRATYTNLDPGRYVFWVQASNNDGVWNEDGVALELVIVPPFWQRGWFYALEGLVALAFLGWIFHLQQRRLERRQRELLRRQDHRRKTRELDTARRVQLSMLPPEDLHTARLEAVGRMVTASEVGGDYFDYVALGPGRHAVTLGDAIGHGSAAGLVVGMVKAALHQALKANASSRPADLLGSLHRTLRTALAHRRSGMGLTLLVTDEGPGDSVDVQLASTAMPYPYLYRSEEDRLETVELGGFPLGLGPDMTHAQRQLTLEPGDVLVLISDGMVERRSPNGDAWGYDALQGTLLDLCRSHPSAESLAQGLLTASHHYARSQPPDDDLTVMVLRCHGC